MDLSPALLSALVPLVLGLVGGSGLLGAYLTYKGRREEAQAKADADRAKAEAEASADRISAQATAMGQAEVARVQAETTREVQADQIDLQRGHTALERIIELERRDDMNQQELLRLTERAAHAEGRVLEIARYAAALEDGFHLERSALVADILLGTPLPLTAALAPEGNVPVSSFTPPVLTVAPAPAPTPAPLPQSPATGPATAAQPPPHSPPPSTNRPAH